MTGPAPDSSHSGPLLAHERYSAFGERRGGEEPKTTEYLFTGQHYNSLFGLYYYGGSSGAGRFYDPVLGRFIQPDDVIQGTGSQGLNRYSYVRNNPLNATDPSGHSQIADTLGSGGGGGVPGAIGGLAIGSILPSVPTWVSEASQAINAFGTETISEWGQGLSDAISRFANGGSDQSAQAPQGGEANSTGDPEGWDPRDPNNRVGSKSVDGPQPWERYQRYVTGKDYEEVWQLSSVDREVKPDAINDGWVVEAKRVYWPNSVYNPANTKFYLVKEPEVLDQTVRQLLFAEEQGAKGVRWAFSSKEAATYYREFFKYQFEEFYKSGFLQVWHVPEADSFIVSHP